MEPDRSLMVLHDAHVLPGRVGALATLHEMFDVQVPRHPGFGVDDELAETWDSVGDLAQYHIERIRASGERRHLLGAGFGGWVALEMAVRAREWISSLMLVAPYGLKVFGRLDREFADVLLLDPDELIELGWADPNRCTDIRMPGFPNDLDDAADARAFQDRAALARYGWKPFMHDPRLARWLSVLNMPVLVLAGSHDRMLAPQHSRKVAERLGAQFVEIENSGHYPYLETQGAFVAAVCKFLDEVDEVRL